MRPSQQSVLNVLRGLTPSGWFERTTAVWRSRKPPDAFEGFDSNQQQALVKTLLMAPAFTVFGMGDDGVPLVLGNLTLPPLIVPVFAPAILPFTLGTVPAGEEWDLLGFGGALTTSVLVGSRRVNLRVVDLTSGGTSEQFYRAEADQPDSTSQVYGLAVGADLGTAAAVVAPVENQIRVGVYPTAVAGQSFLITVNPTIPGDAFLSVTATIRRRRA